MIFKDTMMEFECSECEFSTDNKSGLNTHIGHEHPGKSLWDDPEELNRLYWDEGLTQKEIAEELGCSEVTIQRKIEEFGIDVRGRRKGTVHSTPASHYINEGYEKWSTGGKENKSVAVHQILACLNHDPHEVFADDTHVHHGNNNHPYLPEAEHRLANWEGNLEVMSIGKHISHHKSDSKREKSAMDW